MLARKCIVVLRQRIIVLVIDKPLCQFAVPFVPASLIRQEEIFRQRVGFVPGVGDGFMWACFLLSSTECFLRQVWQHRVRTSLQYVQRDRVLRKLMSIDKTTASFVECVTGQPVV